MTKLPVSIIIVVTRQGLPAVIWNEFRTAQISAFNYLHFLKLEVIYGLYYADLFSPNCNGNFQVLHEHRKLWMSSAEFRHDQEVDLIYSYMNNLDPFSGFLI